MFKEDVLNSTRDLFEAEAVKAIVAKLLEENSLGHQQRRILKLLVEHPNAYTHEIRQACSSGHPTLRMREMADLLMEYGLRITGKPAPKSYRNKFDQYSAVHFWAVEVA